MFILLMLVVSVAIGGVHPCSRWGELRWAERILGGRADGGPGIRQLDIGEAAVFRVEPERETP